ncbi:MAG: sigma 54-interacting transcriptional regulator [Polyangiaceae bacterium]
MDIPLAQTTPLEPAEETASQWTLEIGRERPTAPWWIEGASLCQPAVRVLKEGEGLVIGSGPGAHWRVIDRAVSATHCALAVEDGRLVVRDMGSRNGVFVGGARVEQAELGPGASFVIGRIVLTCRPGSARSTGEDLVAAPLPGFVGGSLAVRRVTHEARRVANVKGPVLLRGETGTGKDVLARALHAVGPRRGGPFVPLNVATLPRELADAELFGHERGAYTGAHGAREGAFAQAHGGTLFLDEIAELAPDLQVKLLRVLEDGEVRPIGGRTRRKVDVRIVSATWAPLHQRVAEGRFRQDLYQRLAVFVIDVPPLRERRSDLPTLVEHFLRELSEETGVREISAGALAKLAAYGFPGNVRELRNVLYRASLGVTGRMIGTQEVVASLEIGSAPQRTLVSTEEARAVVESHGGNVSAAARHLGVARSTFRDLLGAQSKRAEP